jgi:MipA family protein
MKAAQQRRSRVMVLCVALQAVTTVATAQEMTKPSPSAPAQQPLWELGLGVGGLHLPGYRGSDQNQDLLAPFPYVVYRGTWFKADRNGARALLLHADRASLDLSVGASPPTRSRDTTARVGMPDLPGTLEVGPNLNVLLATSAKNEWRLELRLPARAALTLERTPRFVGSTFSPNLNLDLERVVGGWNVGLLTGPLFADTKNHGFFYNVDVPYANAGRPSHSAKGGYSGWRALAATSRRFGDAWVGAFIRYDHLRGAAFENSPLVRRTSALSAGFAVAWVFAASSQQVASGE